jgi:hypothetical protein
MRNLRTVMLVAGVLALGAASLAQASGKPAPPNSSAGGATLSAWLSDWWTTIVTAPLATNPYTGGDQCVPLDKHTIGPFVLPPDQPPLTCTVKPGTRVLVVGATAECSDIEAAPFHAESLTEALSCAKAWIGDLTRHTLIVDGRRTDLLAGHGVETPYITAMLPPDNIFGVDPQPIHFAAFGYAALLSPLPPGRHVITVEQVGQAEHGGPISPTFSVTVVVQPGVRYPGG